MGGYLNLHQGKLSGDYVTVPQVAYQVEREEYPFGFDGGPRRGIEGNRPARARILRDAFTHSTAATGGATRRNHL